MLKLKPCANGWMGAASAPLRKRWLLPATTDFVARGELRHKSNLYLLNGSNCGKIGHY